MFNYIKAIYNKIEDYDSSIKEIREDIKDIKDIKEDIRINNREIKEMIGNFDVTLRGGMKTIQSLENRVRKLEEGSAVVSAVDSAEGSDVSSAVGSVVSYASVLMTGLSKDVLSKDILSKDGLSKDGLSKDGAYQDQGKIVRENMEETIINKKMMIVSNASRRIGLYPVSVDNVRKFSSNKYGIDAECYNTQETKEARFLAADEFLVKELKFNQKEIVLEDAMIAKKEDSKILWITTTPDTVKRIYRRIAAVKSRGTRIILYTPKEMWRRKLSIEKNCKEARSKEPRLRTQVRYEHNDFGLYTKFQYEPYYVRTPLTAYGDIDDFELEDQAFSPPRTRIGQPPLQKRELSPQDQTDGQNKRINLNASPILNLGPTAEDFEELQTTPNCIGNMVQDEFSDEQEITYEVTDQVTNDVTKDGDNDVTRDEGDEESSNMEYDWFEQKLEQVSPERAKEKTVSNKEEQKRKRISKKGKTGV